MKNIAFIVGAQRSGTTFLFQQLNQHPEVCMAKPVRPEPKFFIREELYNKGLEFYRSTYYAEAGNKVCIEKSTSYIEYELAAQRISQAFHHAKIIFILRNPVERAISNYRFS